MKILFIGGGNMCQAIIGGLIAKGTPTSDLHAIEPLAETRAALARVGVASSGELHERDLAVDVLVFSCQATDDDGCRRAVRRKAEGAAGSEHCCWHSHV